LEEDGVEKKNSAAGYFNISSPELTALNFMSFNGKIGGISRIIPILGELVVEGYDKQRHQPAGDQVVA
jgi:hypothetical protein